MDTARARALLESLSQVVDEGVLQWRGGDLDGSDVDLVVLPGAKRGLERELRAAGLSPAPAEPGRTLWTGHQGALVVDVLDASAWPAMYPPLERVLARAERPRGSPRAACDADRLLILAAEAVAGRPLEKIARKVRPLLDRPGVRDRLARTAAEEGAAALAVLISDPVRLERRARRGRLPYPDAAQAALRSRTARAALAGRAVGAARARLRRRPRGLLITISGMDGSGKSRATDHVRGLLEREGFPATTVWGRLAHERELLLLALPVKRLLRRRDRIADRVAAAVPGSHDVASPPAASAPRRGPVAWGWTVVVVLVSLRSHRRAVRPVRRGRSVVCDRWLLDAVVDLELRYGRHRIARLMLERGVPRPDLSMWLDVDAATAAARKPGDQDIGVLRRMEARYAKAAGRYGAIRVDALAPPADVDARVGDLVRTLLPTRPARTGRRPSSGGS